MKQSLDALQSLLHEVEMDWRQTTGPQANPLDIALPLLDNTSVGLAHRQGEFTELKRSIEQGLRVAVSQHFEAFNDSIGSYRDVVRSVANSRTILSGLQQQAEATESTAQDHVAAISSVNENFKIYNEMVEILGVVGKVKQAPQELDSALSEKNYSRAQQIIQKVYDDANEYSLWELPALSNLKEYFHIQEDQLFGILVEDLHNTIFSKTQFEQFNTVHDILRPQSQGWEYSHIEKFLVSAIDTDLAQAASINHAAVDSFINSLSINSMDLDQEDNNLAEPASWDDSNPFNHLLQIMTIVGKLGRLGTLAETMKQRFSLELAQLVNRVVEDTNLKHPKLVKVLNSNTSGPMLAHDNYAAVVLQDLFWNFFKKILFLLQSMRVITEIKTKFESDTFKSQQHKIDSGLEIFWNEIQKEVQHLILTYISDDISMTQLNSKLTNTSITNKTSKNIFQFYHVEYDKTQTTQLKLVLQDLFPGFINSNEMQVDSPYIEDNKFLKQTRIIPANVSHMRYILEPLLLFIQGSSFLLPNSALWQPVKFFNDIMQREFLPILEDNVVQYYSEEVEGIDALTIYDIDTKTEMLIGQHTEKPVKLLAIFVQFKSFLNSLLFNLNTSLQFREEFIPVIFKVMTMFHDKVEEIYKELFTELVNYLEPNKAIISALRTKSKLALSAQVGAHFNLVEFKNSNIKSYFDVLHNSLALLLNWFDNHLVKTIDLNKTDLNVSQGEKLRKTWFFFQFQGIAAPLNDDPMNVRNTQKLILDEHFRLKYTEVIKDYKELQLEVDNVLRLNVDLGKLK